MLQTEARVTLIDAALAASVLTGLVLNCAFGWWRADPLAGFVIVYYGIPEGRGALAPCYHREVADLFSSRHDLVSEAYNHACDVIEAVTALVCDSRLQAPATVDGGSPIVMRCLPVAFASVRRG